MMQAATISMGDQEILLKTQKKSHQSEDTEEVVRESISQRITAVNPIFAYNIGQTKLVFQNTLPKGKSYLYELDHKEKFINFV